MTKRKSKHEIAIMKKAGSIVAEVHAAVKEAIKPGISTYELDKIAEDVIKKHGAVPCFLGYKAHFAATPYPATICSSVNEQVVHGIPSKDVILKEGDIISVDVGANYRGMVGDSAWTYAVGEISDELKKLLKATEEALFASIDKARADSLLIEVSGAVEDTGKKYGFGVVTQYGGHGVGSEMHEEPFVFNMRVPSSPGPVMKPGMTIAIEPMFNLGTGMVHTDKDGWTVVTDDGKYSAHFEHTIAITDSEPEILTVLS
jgi:methionyl aminopeptidase